jgi:flavin reductase (DIM6/NTAB) family NADH-FMN oxidoreductase RutF
MVEKADVDSKSMWLLMHPRNTVLVTSLDDDGNPNIITLAWSMITSFNPTMVAISVAPARYSHDLIKDCGEFVVNIPNMDIVKETLFCGRNSGKSVDKFAATGLTPMPAKFVKAPLISECVAHMECKVVNALLTGDHTIFVGEVVAAYVNEDLFDKGFDTSKIKPVLHRGFDEFVTIDPTVTTPSRKL